MCLLIATTYVYTFQYKGHERKPEEQAGAHGSAVGSVAIHILGLQIVVH